MLTWILAQVPPAAQRTVQAKDPDRDYTNLIIFIALSVAAAVGSYLLLRGPLLSLAAGDERRAKLGRFLDRGFLVVTVLFLVNIWLSFYIPGMLMTLGWWMVALVAVSALVMAIMERKQA